MRLGLYDYLRVGHIKRWHNVNTIRQQTVAEHSYLVAIIALDLYHGMVAVPSIPNVESEGLIDLLLGALFHDAPEAAAGDMPTPAKRLMRQITGDEDVFEKVDQYLMPELPYVGGTVDPKTAKYIKMADAIEGYHWITDNGAGTHAEIVKMSSRRRVEDLVQKYHAADPDAGWYEAVNRVLMAMGVPYVHKESRISPP